MTETCERCIFYRPFPADGEPAFGACTTNPPVPIVLAGERVEWQHPVVHRTTPACRHFRLRPL